MMVDREMISPENYYELQKNKPYEELLTEKSKLIQKIEEFERSDNITIDEISPSSDVRYQMDLLYLAKLCELISDKYNKLLNLSNNVIWGNYAKVVFFYGTINSYA